MKFKLKQLHTLLSRSLSECESVDPNAWPIHLVEFTADGVASCNGAAVVLAHKGTDTPSVERLNVHYLYVRRFYELAIAALRGANVPDAIGHSFTVHHLAGDAEFAVELPGTQFVRLRAPATQNKALRWRERTAVTLGTVEAKVSVLWLRSLLDAVDYLSLADADEDDHEDSPFVTLRIGRGPGGAMVHMANDVAAGAIAGSVDSVCRDPLSAHVASGDAYTALRDLTPGELFVFDPVNVEAAGWHVLLADGEGDAPTDGLFTIASLSDGEVTCCATDAQVLPLRMGGRHG